MKYQLLDPFLTISHIIYFCYALSKGYYVSGNNKWSETVESSSLNMTFNLKGPGDIPVVGGWVLEAEPRAKGCKMPSSKLNTTTAVLKSQLESSSRGPYKTGLLITEGREAHGTLLLTVNTDRLWERRRHFQLSAHCWVYQAPNKMRRWMWEGDTQGVVWGRQGNNREWGRAVSVHVTHVTLSRNKF